jgi:hypothetical protein
MIKEEEKTINFETQAEEARAVMRHLSSNLLNISGDGEEDLLDSSNNQLYPYKLGTHREHLIPRAQAHFST